MSKHTPRRPPRPIVEVTEDVDDLITADVGAVRLRVVVDGEVWYIEGSSRRDPVDKPDDLVASYLAYGRAFESLSRRLLKRADGLVKHNDDIRQMKSEKQPDQINKAVKKPKKKVAAKKVPARARH